jgi:hypothetical protein
MKRKNQRCLSGKNDLTGNELSCEFADFSAMERFFSILPSAVTFSAYSFVWQTKG